MTTPKDHFWPRRLIAALIVALALAASGYLTRTGGTALALTAPAASGLEELGDPAARPVARTAPDGDPSVPSASSLFAHASAEGRDDAAPGF